jgi:hypothetical protein
MSLNWSQIRTRILIHNGGGQYLKFELRELLLELLLEAPEGLQGQVHVQGPVRVLLLQPEQT